MEGAVGWQSPSPQHWLFPCGMHPTTQDGPLPLTSDLPVKEGKCFAGRDARCAACPRSPRHPCWSTSPAFGQGGSLPCCPSIPPLRCSAGQVCPAEPPSFQRPTGLLWWEKGDLETQEQAPLPLTCSLSSGRWAVFALACRCPSSCSDVLVITQLAANGLMLSQ